MGINHPRLGGGKLTYERPVSHLNVTWYLQPNTFYKRLTLTDYIIVT